MGILNNWGELPMCVFSNNVSSINSFRRLKNRIKNPVRVNTISPKCFLLNLRIGIFPQEIPEGKFPSLKSDIDEQIF